MSVDPPVLRKRSLRDAALCLQLHSAWRRDPPAPPLAFVFPELSTYELATATLEAGALLARAYSAGDEALANKHRNHSEIIAKLQAEHPGFTDEGYSEVITYGCYLAR
jgi:hypothetical protein